MFNHFSFLNISFVFHRYYHNENDIDDESQPIMENTENNNEITEINLTNDTATDIDVPNLELDIPSSGFEETDSETPNRESSEEKSRSNNVLSEINIEAKNNRNIEKIVSISPSNTTTPSISLTQSPSTETEVEPKPSCSTESTSAPSSAEETPTTTTTTTTIKIRKNNSKLKTGHNNNKSYIAKPSISSIPKINSTEASTSTVEVVKVKKLSLRPSSIKNQSTFTTSALLSGRDSASDASGRYSSSVYESARSDKKKGPLKSNTGNNNHKMNRKLTKNDTDTLGAAPMSATLSSRSPKRSSLLRKFMNAPPANINISSDFCKDSNHAKCDEQSNMFLYIDLHGHASKKGIFMYGNYLPKIAESVECMLLPRLMSMNSHHFHFDACVFSERNMYHK